MSELLEEYLGRVRLGEQTKEFLRSPVGSVILNAAHDEIDAGHEQLETANTIEEVREAQCRVWRGRSLITWLDELIMVGEEARIQIEDNID